MVVIGVIIREKYIIAQNMTEGDLDDHSLRADHLMCRLVLPGEPQDTHLKIYLKVNQD